MISKSFKEYLKVFGDPDDSTFDWVDFVGSFRREILENPGKFPEFIGDCNKAFEKIIPGIHHKIRDKLTLEYLAGMPVLAYHPADRILLESFLKSDFERFSSMYGNPEDYGSVMKVFLRFLGLEWEFLGEYVFGNCNFNH